MLLLSHLTGWLPYNTDLSLYPRHRLRIQACVSPGAGVPVGADGAGGAAESIVNQTAVDVLRRLPVSYIPTRFAQPSVVTPPPSDPQ